MMWGQRSSSTPANAIRVPAAASTVGLGERFAFCFQVANLSRQPAMLAGQLLALEKLRGGMMRNDVNYLYESLVPWLASPADDDDDTAVEDDDAVDDDEDEDDDDEDDEDEEEDEDEDEDGD